MRTILLFSFVFIILSSSAASVDTVSIYSAAMKKEFKCVVIKPDAYKKKKRSFPVVYLLHGYDGYYSNWITRVPQLKDHADEFELLIVCPEGGKSSWYFDSPIDSTTQFETYIGKEVPQFIDSKYRTIKKREGRAITGLSMGGHGALFIALRRADFFGACGSISGVVDLSSSRNKYELTKRIGDTVNYAENWKKYSVINIVEAYAKDTLAMIIDCGISDAFYPLNKALHEKLLRLKIPHDYSERPGNHSWGYWSNSIPYHLLFFRRYFDKNVNN